MKNRVVQIISDIFIILAIGTIYILVSIYVKPFVKGFYCNDNDIFYPLKPDTVPTYAAGLFGIGGTIFFILLIELFNYLYYFKKENLSGCKSFSISIYHGLSLFLLGTAITMTLTEIGKRWIGRLRPHFIDVCQPDLSKVNCTVIDASNIHAIYNYISTDGAFCRGDEDGVNEARLSFPSGHSSLSCYTMLFLIIYLQARLVLLRFRFFKVLLQFTAFIAAYITCISRISDYHHRGSDVLGGAALGIVVAYFITIVSGKVIWLYGDLKDQHDFDLKIKTRNNCATSEVELV